ncbi:hypothetical protein llap_14656 [Limosa lapponica baueri]|uniref:Uncharacterized protein n=1 Tax=Limosa lapponica baueri TaxID=1758121 RepID=A0A2I0TMK3_LIMLA|nr:hypothetical protein llap_14656 [Limosa lapponica baueri]
MEEATPLAILTPAPLESATPPTSPSHVATSVRTGGSPDPGYNDTGPSHLPAPTGKSHSTGTSPGRSHVPAHLGTSHSAECGKSYSAACTPHSCIASLSPARIDTSRSSLDNEHCHLCFNSEYCCYSNSNRTGRSCPGDQEAEKKARSPASHDRDQPKPDSTGESSSKEDPGEGPSQAALKEDSDAEIIIKSFSMKDL